MGSLADRSSPWLPLGGPVRPATGTVDVVAARPRRGHLDEFERGRVLRLTDRGAQRSRRVPLQAAARAALARLTGLDASALPLVRGDDGRPGLDGLDLAVSLSYADDLVVLVVTRGAERRIGVDVERKDPRLAVADVVSVACGEREAADLARIADGATRREALLRSWTVKEALLKAAGTGLTLDPADVVPAVHPGRLGLTAVPTALAPADRWSLAAVDPTADHVATLALLGPAPSRLRRWRA